MDLAALVSELQFLRDGKLNQIYHPQKNELIFQIHARAGQGKQLLRIIPGKFMNLTSEKESSLRPSGFCMQLRKYLSGAFIREIYQKGSERIVVFVLEKAVFVADVGKDSGEKKILRYHLVAEFFSKGNFLVADANWQIIGTLSRQIWESRTIKAKEKYEFPPAKLDWKEVKEAKFREIVLSSEKKNLATCLATEIGLGGVIAEELCARKKVDSKQLPGLVKEGEVKLLFAALQEVLDELDAGKGFLFSDGDMSPLHLVSKEVEKEFANFNAALATVDPFERVSPYQQKIANQQKIISQQEESLKKIEQRIEEYGAMGEVVYSNYAALSQLLLIVKDLRSAQGMGWASIKDELLKESKISKVDLKNKKIVIDL